MMVCSYKILTNHKEIFLISLLEHLKWEHFMGIAGQVTQAILIS